MEDVIKVLENETIRKFIIEKFGEKILTEFMEEVIPMGKWVVKGVKFFRALRRAKVDYEEITSASNQDTALHVLVKSIADAPDNSETTAGFMGALNIEEEYTALVKPKLQAAFLEEFMGFLKSLPPTMPLSKANINGKFKQFMLQKTGAQPEIGDQ